MLHSPIARMAATLLVVASAAFAGATAVAQEPLPPLSSVPVPEPTNLDQYVSNKAAAIRLGKALFWDMQAGSDGIQACGSCHFHAGADRRLKNQLNPGLNGSPPDTTFAHPGGPNFTLSAENFPFHMLANPDDPTSVVSDRNDIASSQGVFNTLFVDVVPGSAVDNVALVFDPVFNVDGINTRRVEPRNTPTVINAIFNFRNFWDGRAQSDFNGANPFGARDVNAAILKVNLASGVPKQVQSNLTEGASLASLATGPPLSAFEMSGAGRSFPKLGKKLTSLRPLGKQRVAVDDSVLGSLSRAGATLPGLNTTYVQMIQAAFRPEWWNSPKIVTFDANGKPKISNPPNRELTTSEFTVMQANFSLFWGLSVQLYLATLVAGDTPFDRFLGGQESALTDQQKTGLGLFNGKAGCVRCHSGPELTEASFSESSEDRIDVLTTLSGVVAKYDEGFLNTGVRATSDDPGIGGRDPFGNPLSETERLKLGLLPPGTFNLDVAPDEPIAVAGAFKIPGLRNVELTAPFFHNGGTATLEQVVDFYNRGGDFSLQQQDQVRNFMTPLGLTTTEKADLVAFLKALTDERVRFERAPFDHPQIFVPNGHPGSQNHVFDDGTGRATDDLLEVPAVGAGGGPALPSVF
jgi:cytochrome c peroxidase